MSRTATWTSAAIAAASLGLAGWLWHDNRALRAELAAKPASSPSATVAAAAAATDPWQPTTTGAPRVGSGSGDPRPVDLSTAPALPDEPKESRLERHARRGAEFAAMFGRSADETDAEYKARIAPIIGLALTRPRSAVAEMRSEAEARAGVTPEQHAKIDAALDKVYGDALDYVNGAIADGALTPDKRDFASLLEVAGGLGPILRDAEGQIGHVLSPEQVKAMYDSGFDWAQYLGASAPWERLGAPPIPK